MNKAIFFLCSFIGCFSNFYLQANATLGYPAPTFTAKDIQGTEVSLDTLLGKVVVIEWISQECDVVKKQYSRIFYKGEGYMQTLQKKFTAAPYNIIWICVDSSRPTATADSWKTWIQENGAAPSCLIIDTKEEIAKAYKVSCIPEVFIINQEGILVYKGAIDSIRSTDPTDISLPANRHFVETALNQLLQGKKIFTPETIPYGCSVSY